MCSNVCLSRKVNTIHGSSTFYLITAVNAIFCSSVCLPSAVYAILFCSSVCLSSAVYSMLICFSVCLPTAVHARDYDAPHPGICHSIYQSKIENFLSLSPSFNISLQLSQILHIKEFILAILVTKSRSNNNIITESSRILLLLLHCR